MDTLLDDPILPKIRAALDAIYGDRIERVVLFGSRARGDAEEDSDYDIAVFLHGMTDRWVEFDRLAELSVVMLDEAGVLLDAKPYRAGFDKERTPLMREVRIEGLDF